MSNLSTLPKGDSAWLLRKAIERIIQQISVLETNIGSSTTGNSANTQVIFNDNGVLRGDTGLTYNASSDILSFGAGICYGDLTVDTSTLKVDSTNNRVGIVTASPAFPLDVNGAGSSVAARISSGSGTGFRFDTTRNISGLNRNYLIGCDILNEGWFSIVPSTALGGGTFSNPVYNVSSDGTHAWSDGAGGERMRLNSTGLGIGVTPTNKLDVSSTDAAVTLRVNTQNAGASASNYSQIQLSDVGTVRSYWRNVRDGAGTTQFAYNSYLQFLSDAAGTPTERMRIDSSGNVGIGVTPSAWSSGIKVIEFGTKGGLAGSGSDVNLIYNAYYDGSNKYRTSDYANNFQIAGGQFKWLTAPSGTAGNAITYTQSMTLDASGNLLVGTTATGGSASNSAKIVGGFFSSVNASTASTASGSAVTLFAAPNEAVFIVSAYIFGTGSPSAYNAVAIVKVSGASATVTTISSATGLSLSVSGLNVQATQTSGSSQVIVYSAIRIS